MNQTDKTIKVKPLFNGEFVHVHSIQYRTPDGKEGTWEMVSRKSNPEVGNIVTHAITIAPMFTNGDVCIIKEYRPALGGYEFGFPAGIVDEGETPGEAAIRELKEETGLETVVVNYIGPPVASSSGLTDEITRPVLVICDGQFSSSGHKWHEDIEPLRLSRSKLRALLEDPNIIWGARAWGILYGLIMFDDR